MLNKSSPYIANPKRLADLIAAIQVLGTYRFASRQTEKWEKRLGRTPISAPDWSTLFSQHPEFFTAQGDKISLVWRRSRERNYDTHTRALLPRAEAMALAQEESEDNEFRLSRPPLDSTEVSKLVDIAINLHEREIRHAQERRWWITAVIAILGLIITISGSK
ncbi:MAG: hypothetical protein MI864_11665 [Pseudomonadales bacterium]|nr:hypothetical protein [Pseudomonadales bacterium]